MIQITIPPRKLYPKLIELWEASVRATHYFLEEEDIIYFRKKILDEYFYLVDLYIATDEDKKVLGFIGLSANKIEMLFIDPDFRNRGIGKLLVDFAKITHQADRVDVNEQNYEAIKFYQNLGYQIVNRSLQDRDGKPFPILEMQLIK